MSTIQKPKKEYKMFFFKFLSNLVLVSFKINPKIICLKKCFCDLLGNFMYRNELNQNLKKDKTKQ